MVCLVGLKINNQNALCGFEYFFAIIIYLILKSALLLFCASFHHSKSFNGLIKN